MSSYLYRGSQSPQQDSFSTFSNNPLSPNRSSNRLSTGASAVPPAQQASEVRGGLTRRFTTNGLPTLSPIGQQRLQAAGDNTVSLGYATRVAPSERKIRHIESLLEQQRRINAELEQVDGETRREIEEGLRHERAVTDFIAQSEPTTPPEYQDSFPAAVPRPNRYSITSLTSPSSFASRPHRSSTHLTSPASNFVRPYTAHATQGFPSQSVPGSRRHSEDEDEDDYLLTYDTGMHRAAANPNRNSMPVLSYDRKRSAADLSAALGPLNTTSFLFDDEEKPANRANPSSPDAKTYLQVQHTPDGFPKLIRREDNVEGVSSSPPAALDLALTPPLNGDSQTSDRVMARRHRVSLPPSALSSNGTMAPLNSILAATNDGISNNRRSLEVTFSADAKRPSLMATPARALTESASKTLMSYSTNDIPTLKTINGDHPSTKPIGSPPTESIKHVETTTLDQTTPSMAANVKQNRQSQDISGSRAQDSGSVFETTANGLHPSAAPFGPLHDTPVQQFSPPTMPFGSPGYYSPYGMQMLTNGFAAMNMNGNGLPMGIPMNGANLIPQAQWPSQAPMYPQVGFAGYPQFAPRVPTATTTPTTTNTNNNNNNANRAPRPANNGTPLKLDGEDVYNAIRISQLRGQIYGLCKDQHGCRFLQRKLDERREQDVQVIFDEVKNHFTELMTDPFGNYLCQRLLEHANNEQRTALIQNAAPSMTNIAVNQHGTRALQRMIEFISTKEQTQVLIDALGNDVVQLIQDLNGNHVIQKCLNHLSSEDAEFIFTAVGANCVTVGTHRHGCCVLQRCVDHASGLQKGALVDSIIANAYALVQDPFGNYVVQYVLDLSEPCFTQPLCRALCGNVTFLSKQKFSSNVIEKCIRCADNDTKRLLIQEIMNPTDLEKLLRDSFANYVVQTALDFCPDDLKPLFIESIRPALPAIRNTPHGRRIASKIQDHDFPGNTSWMGGNKGSNTSEPASPPSQIPNGRGNRMGMVAGPPMWSSNNVDATAVSATTSPTNGTHGVHPAVPPTSQVYPMFDSNTMYQQHGYQSPPVFNTNGMNGAPHMYGHF